uniref:Uncharacterized protein n=1 Tax=Oryza punctata TaxID=4537 RepID=A0A0E0LJ20_ORYPU
MGDLPPRPLVKTEVADEGAEPTEEGGGDAQDHPEGLRRKLCVRPPFGDWRSRNEKFVAREMMINGDSYKVVNIANWMRTHPGRTLEDYDRVHAARLEGMAHF